MNYRIVATLGPATRGPDVWKGLLAAGADAFRLNTSHMNLATLEGWLGELIAFHRRLAAGEAGGAAPPVILDLQASKWRIGSIPRIELPAGQKVELVAGGIDGEQRQSSAAVVIPVPHPDFFTAARSSGGEIALNDAKVMLRIESMDSERIVARVERGGEISSAKGITIAASPYRIERLSAKDRRIVELGSRYPNVRFALSYLKDAAEMSNYRRLLDPSLFLIAKVERAGALQEVERIAEIADELWICRGDLGAEMGMALMAAELSAFSQRISRLSKPILLAGQVLEHMSEHPEPTRSEISCLYDALRDGYAGVVLSDETAVGAFSESACRAAALFRGNRLLGG